MLPKPTQKAIWFIESHLGDTITLDDVAAAAGLSRFHVERVFSAVTGLSVMRYIRIRRLSEAARRLGEGSLLERALEAGYGSHEAFTRAYRDQFGLSPEQARARGLPSDQIKDPLHMDTLSAHGIAPLRFVDGPALRLAGLGASFTHDTSGGIPGLWQRLAPFFGNSDGEVPGLAYGVCGPGAEPGAFTYLAGFELAPGAGVPHGLTTLLLAAQRYAVFHHADHVATIRATIGSIFDRWLPGSGYAAADAPFLERYDARFDARTGQGGFEVWLPIWTA